MLGTDRADIRQNGPGRCLRVRSGVPDLSMRLGMVIICKS